MARITKKDLEQELELAKEQIAKYKYLWEESETEVRRLKENTVLSRENINRDGRPKIDPQQAHMIKELHNKGVSQRKIAELVGVSKGTVSKYAK